MPGSGSSAKLMCSRGESGCSYGQGKSGQGAAGMRHVYMDGCGQKACLWITSYGLTSRRPNTSPANIQRCRGVCRADETRLFPVPVYSPPPLSLLPYLFSRSRRKRPKFESTLEPPCSASGSPHYTVIRCINCYPSLLLHTTFNPRPC